eukprot:1159551-Pelagomonas_calceolata.AAC.8
MGPSKLDHAAPIIHACILESLHCPKWYVPCCDSIASATAAAATANMHATFMCEPLSLRALQAGDGSHSPNMRDSHMQNPLG